MAGTEPEKEAPSLGDGALYEILQEAFERKLLDVAVDFKKHNSTASPLFSPWENIVPLVVLVLGSLLFMLTTQALLAGTLGLLVSVAIYLFAARPWAAHRLYLRLTKYLFRDLTAFKYLWKQGGFSLLWLAYPNDVCHAPAGNWRHFAERHGQQMKMLPPPEGEGGDETKGGMPHDRRAH